MKFVGEAIAGPAGARAQRAPALNHELRNDAMKDQSVEKGPLRLLIRFWIGEFLGSLGQPDKILDGLRRLFVERFGDDIALRRLKNGVRSRRACQSELLCDVS